MPRGLANRGVTEAPGPTFALSSLCPVLTFSKDSGGRAPPELSIWDLEITGNFKPTFPFFRDVLTRDEPSRLEHGAPVCLRTVSKEALLMHQR